MKRYLLAFALIFALGFCLCACSPEEPEHIHIFDSWTVKTEADCTTEGLLFRVCLECEAVEEKTVAKLPHTLESSKVDPTCDSEGYTHYECSVCDYEHNSEHIKPLGHTLKSTVTAPTCTEQGYTNYKCEKCDYEYIGDHVKPLGHTLESSVTAPTCTAEGYTHYKCGRCEYEFDADFVEPLQHVNSDAIRFFATVNRSGYTKYTCRDCGHIYNEDFVKYSDVVSGAYVDNSSVLKKGIDVSKWNHHTGATSEDYLPLDWEALKASGVDFVILKIGSTDSGKEPTFEMDYEGARAAGLEVGGYFYTYATTVGQTVVDAGNVLKWIEGKSFEYPIYFDTEDEKQIAISKDQVTDMCFAFAEVIQDGGYYAGVYASYSWLRDRLDMDRISGALDVWCARYYWDDPDGNSSFAIDDQRFIWQESWGKNMGMWQYTQCGNFEGFKYDFDFNYSYKDYAGLMKEWSLNGF